MNPGAQVSHLLEGSAVILLKLVIYFSTYENRRVFGVTYFTCLMSSSPPDRLNNCSLRRLKNFAPIFTLFPKFLEMHFLWSAIRIIHDIWCAVEKEPTRKELELVTKQCKYFAPNFLPGN